MSLSSDLLARALPALAANGTLDRAPHAMVLYDLEGVEGRVEELQRAFPAQTLHAVAIKACPVTELLRRVGRMGLGAEAASIAELHQARRADISPDRIVFDSPAKTTEELRDAFALGVHVNADSLQELDRIARLVTDGDLDVSVGIRINPGVRAGTIEASSTAMPGSKFGVSLHDHADGLLERFRSYPWLQAVHLHVGSQGCDLELLTDGAARVIGFVGEIEHRFGSGRVRAFDLGGGLPVTYRPGDPSPSFSDYARALQARVPELFSRPWRLVTEFDGQSGRTSALP